LSKDGVISNNTAEVGGGIYNDGKFNRQGGTISDNTATQYNDIYHSDNNITTDNGNSIVTDDGSSTSINISNYTVLIVSMIMTISSITVIGCLIIKYKSIRKHSHEHKLN